MTFKPVLTRIALFTLGLTSSTVAQAHDGHVNTPWHAFLHMVEHNGIPLLIAFVVMVGILLLRVRNQRASERIHKEQRHDSR